MAPGPRHEEACVGQTQLLRVEAAAIVKGVSLIDHYRTLGVAATADETVIRAVYVALMKRFHPDRSAAPETLLQAQAINEAYAVLGDPKRRAAYDDERAEMQPWERGSVPPPPRTENIGAVGGAILVLVVGTLAGLYAYWPDLTSAERRRAAAAPIASTPARCASLADPERIRTALIVRLDQAGALDRAAAGALTAARFELGPATGARDLAEPGEVACLATLAITLPTTFQTASGQSTISSRLQYSVSRANPKLGVEVEPDGRLIAALSAIRHQQKVAVANPMLEQDIRVNEPPKLPRPTPLPEPRASRAVAPPPAERVTRPAPPKPAVPVHTARPSEGLGGVDRQTMNFYAQSLRHADGGKRGQLARTHNAFAARLAACGSDVCRRNVYLARNGEISRIMTGER